MSRFTRRAWLKQGLAGAAVALVPRLSQLRAANEAPRKDRGKPTDFQIACMTLPWSRFPLTRALEGIRAAGYRYIAWGTTHRNEGTTDEPVLAPDSPPQKARELAGRCRDMGLEPLMMFSMVYPEKDRAVEMLTQRFRQAEAARIPQVLTFGHTEGTGHALWIERLKKLGPIARDCGVMLVVKQHGGTTGTGEACATIIKEVDDPAIRVNYDAGNVMDYLNVDPLPDLARCAEVVHSFCIKDHRDWPRDEDCGPGLGEIDHYRLLDQVAFTGRKLPLCCENIFEPLVPRPEAPEKIDALARRAREFLETVTTGLQSQTE